MSQRDHETPRLNLGRWILWGLIALVSLVAIVLFFVNLGEDIEATATTVSPLLPQSGEQAEWSIEVGELAPAPGLVTLKGDLPTGFPTETWKDGFQLARSVGESFAWTTDIEPPLPTPVYEIDQVVAENLEPDAKCGELQGIFEEWAEQVAQAPGDARRVEAEAFAQHAVNTLAELGCPDPLP